MVSLVLIDPNVLDDHQKRKHRRVMEFARAIRSKEKVDFRRFLAEMQWYGLRKKVAEEYLDILKDLGKIKIESGFIYWNEADLDEKGNTEVSDRQATTETGPKSS